jgi:arylsulfatase A-like enzyme
MSSIGHNSLDHPNILVVLVDQHRADCVGINGNNDILTPNLDALARDGYSNTNCYSTFPLCTPARYSLMTGLYVRQHMGWGNRSTIPKELPTVGRLLKDAGYHTDYIGKLHFSPTYADMGFEDMLLAEQEGPGRYEDDYHRELRANGLIDFTDMQDQISELRKTAPPEYHANFGTAPTNLEYPYYSTDWIGLKALEHIDKWDNNPQLLFVGFIKPHHPFDTPPPWRDMYDPQKLSILPGWSESVSDEDYAVYPGFFDMKTLTPEVHREILRQYYGSITQIDHYVGQFIEKLKTKGMYDNTLIIYISDHGEYLGHHHLELKNNYLYDPVIKVPLIVKYPVRHPASRKNTSGESPCDSKLVSLIDATATILEAAGIKFPPSLQQKIFPLHVCKRDVIFAENLNSAMIRTQDYKLIQSEKVASCLFDLRKDPYEFANVYNSSEYQEIKAKLLKLLDEWDDVDDSAFDDFHPLEDFAEKRGWNYSQKEQMEVAKKMMMEKYNDMDKARRK